MTATRSDLGGGVGWMVFGLAILAGAWRMDRFEAMGATPYTAPGLVPGIFGLTLVLLGAVLARRGWRAAISSGTPTDGPLLSGRIVIMLALTLGYAAVLIGRAPFWLATLLFVTTFTGLYNDELPPARRALTAVAAGVLTTLVVVLVFERVFLVRLP